MERALIGFAGGAVSGALAGLLLSLFVWWGKDLRDARLRAARIPLPSDRVFPGYHWPIAGLGAIQGASLAIAYDVSPIWAALSIFAIPALFLPILALSGLFALLRPYRAPRDFDPGMVIGKDLEEAKAILLKDQWPYEVIEEEPAEGFIARRRPDFRLGACIELSLRDGRVTRAELAQ